MFIELEKDNLAEILQENQNVFVQFSAGWCGNCKIMKPKFKRFSEEDHSATFVIVDAENFPESRKLAKVDNLPTFAKFVNGEFKGQIQTNKAETLKEFLYETTNH